MNAFEDLGTFFGITRKKEKPTKEKKCRKCGNTMIQVAENVWVCSGEKCGKWITTKPGGIRNETLVP